MISLIRDYHINDKNYEICRSNFFCLNLSVKYLLYQTRIVSDHRKFIFVLRNFMKLDKNTPDIILCKDIRSSMMR